MEDEVRVADEENAVAAQREQVEAEPLLEDPNEIVRTSFFGLIRHRRNNHMDICCWTDVTKGMLCGMILAVFILVCLVLYCILI